MQKTPKFSNHFLHTNLHMLQQNKLSFSPVLSSIFFNTRNLFYSRSQLFTFPLFKKFLPILHQQLSHNNPFFYQLSFFCANKFALTNHDFDHFKLPSYELFDHLLEFICMLIRFLKYSFTNFHFEFCYVLITY